MPNVRGRATKRLRFCGFFAFDTFAALERGFDEDEVFFFAGIRLPVRAAVSRRLPHMTSSPWQCNTIR